MYCEFGLTGHRSCQVPGGAGVNPGVFRASVQDHQGTLIIVVHKCVMTTLRQQDIILEAKTVHIDLILKDLYSAVNTIKLILMLKRMKTLSQRMSGTGLPSTTTAKRGVSPAHTSKSSMIVSNVGGAVDTLQYQVRFSSIYLYK